MKRRGASQREKLIFSPLHSLSDSIQLQLPPSIMRLFERLEILWIVHKGRDLQTAYLLSSDRSYELVSDGDGSLTVLPCEWPSCPTELQRFFRLTSAQDSSPNYPST
jgi:hypothetical protein